MIHIEYERGRDMIIRDGCRKTVDQEVGYRLEMRGPQMLLHNIENPPPVLRVEPHLCPECKGALVAHLKKAVGEFRRDEALVKVAGIRANCGAVSDEDELTTLKTNKGAIHLCKSCTVSTSSRQAGTIDGPTIKVERICAICSQLMGRGDTGKSICSRCEAQAVKR